MQRPIYDSEITKDLTEFRLRDGVVKGALHLRHLNPQTQAFTLQRDPHAHR